MARVQVRHLGGWRYEIVLTCGIVELRSDTGYPVKWGRKRAVRYAERLLAEYLGKRREPVVVADFSAPVGRPVLPPLPPLPSGIMPHD